MAQLRRAPGAGAELVLFRAPRMLLFLQIQDNCVDAQCTQHPRGTQRPRYLAVGCRLVAPVSFLKQVCCHRIRLHLRPVACRIEIQSTFDLANVFARRLERNPSDFILLDFPFLLIAVVMVCWRSKRFSPPVLPSVLLTPSRLCVRDLFAAAAR